MLKLQNGIETVTHATAAGKKKHVVPSKLQLEKSDLSSQNELHENVKGSSSSSSSIDLSSDMGSPVNNYVSVSHFPNSGSTKIQNNGESQGAHTSSLPLVFENAEESTNKSARSNGDKYLADVHENVDENNDGKNRGIDKDFLEGTVRSDDGSTEGKDVDSQKENRGERQKLNGKRYSGEDESDIVQDVMKKQVPVDGDTLSLTKGNIAMQESILNNNKLKPVKSVRLDSTKNGLLNSNKHTEVKEIGGQVDAQDSSGNLRSKERKDAKVFPRDPRSATFESKIEQLEHRIKMLEGELREAAAVEAALYSVVADHGSSMNKVHTPARRLSRLYLHAYRESSHGRRATAARSAVSGLVLVAKACGNDVPR